MIEARQLRVRLGGRVVLQDVDMSIERGQILGIIGTPLAGKTTLLKALAALVSLSRGDLCWCGEPVSLVDSRARAAWRRCIGMAFQNDALFDTWTVANNVAFPLHLRKVDASQVAKRVSERLSQVDLEQAAELLPAELSGGMRKRVGIARAVIANPAVGLFDDPVAGLDPVTGDRILQLIVQWTHALKMATAIVSNDLAGLLPICHRVLMLHAGRVLYQGAADGLMDSSCPEVVQFASGSDNGPL